MGAEYFIVLDNVDPGFDTFVSGKAVAREMDAISAIAESFGLPDIHDFASFASMAEEFHIDSELPLAREKWFPAAEGAAWVSAVRKHVESNPSSVKNPAAVEEDLAQYQRVLEQAARVGCKWHFEIDI